MAKTIIASRDLEHLAERLLARSRSRLNDETSLANDLRLAGKLLTKWTRGDFDLGLPLSLMTTDRERYLVRQGLAFRLALFLDG
jgi:hypothetical protein